MRCWSVKRRSTDYVDGRLRQGERSRLEAHLSECEDCEVRVHEIRSVRSALGKLAEPKAPSELRTKLQVTASHERQSLLQTDGSRLLRIWNNWKFRVDEIMRPLTIPATGGLLSSLILFGALAFTIRTTTTGVTYDVPVFYANHADPNLVPVELRSSVVLTLSLDGSGRITNYAVRDRSGSFVGDATRLQGNNISLPDFRSVLAMAQPTTRDISISFIPMVFQR